MKKRLNRATLIKDLLDRADDIKRLVTYGPLSYDRALDMNHIATSTLKEIE